MKLIINTENDRSIINNRYYSLQDLLIDAKKITDKINEDNIKSIIIETNDNHKFSDAYPWELKIILYDAIWLGLV